MQNPVKALKQNVHANPQPYILAATAAGFVAGAVITRKLTPVVKVNGDDIIQQWINYLDLKGKNVYVMPKELHENVMALLDN